jgi:signal transduction histidine kinase
MSIRLKLILSFLAVALVGVLIVAIMAGRATSEQFGNFVYQENAELIASDLAQLYEENGDWGFSRPGQPAGSGMMRGQGHMGGVGMNPAGLWFVVDPAGAVVVPGGGYGRGEQVAPGWSDRGVPIEVDQQTIGFLLVSGQPRDILSPAGERFLGQVNQALMLGAGVAIIVAIVLAALLAGQLTGALRQLTAAARSLAAGGLGHQVDLSSGDEVGELANAFNQMSRELASAENLRRQMSADIAHELRTPLSLILGQSEAMLDEVMPADEENLQLLHREAQRLNRIVEDLRTLSMADAGELSMQLRLLAPIELASRLVKARQAVAASRQISLETELPVDAPQIEGDSDRLEQALGNLLDNAMRFTPVGGRVVLALQVENDGLRFMVEDEGPGIDAEDLPHIFDRFYRSDKARSRQQGGSGLGLAIARSIARAHGGNLTASNRAEGGARFSLQLPTRQSSS